MTTETLPPHRVVNGEIVLLTAQEIAALEAEWANQPPPPVPAQITARQFLIQLAVSGIISEADALDAARTGAVPAPIDAIFATLQAAQAMAARITWARMTTVPRNDPLFVVAGPTLGLTDADLDDFFRAAAAIP